MTKDSGMVGKINIGISSCLLGNNVRYDGGHKRDNYIVDTLGAYFNFVPVCPEVEIGMGVPRESVRLVGTSDVPRMVASRTGKDWTEQMTKFVAARVGQLESSNLRGYILKKASPSCGMERVKVYCKKGTPPQRNARGFFGRALIEHFPRLPVEEEGRLNDAALRENFIVRVFAYDRLRKIFDGRFKRGAAIEFHAAHKYLIMAHSPVHYKQMGQLVAAIKKYKPSDFSEEYSNLFMNALSIRTTVRKNTNVLHHIMGYLKDKLASGDKKYINNVIDDYYKGFVPLIVPITLVKHYISKFNIEYISDQYYLHPHPKELMLRNHV